MNHRASRMSRLGSRSKLTWWRELRPLHGRNCSPPLRKRWGKPALPGIPPRLQPTCEGGLARLRGAATILLQLYLGIDDRGQASAVRSPRHQFASSAWSRYTRRPAGFQPLSRSTSKGCRETKTGAFISSSPASIRNKATRTRLTRLSENAEPSHANGITVRGLGSSRALRIRAGNSGSIRDCRHSQNRSEDERRRWSNTLGTSPESSGSVNSLSLLIVRLGIGWRKTEMRTALPKRALPLVSYL